MLSPLSLREGSGWTLLPALCTHTPPSPDHRPQRKVNQEIDLSLSGGTPSSFALYAKCSLLAYSLFISLSEN